MTDIQVGERSRFMNVFGKREIEVLAMELLDRELLRAEFTRAEAIRKDPDFLGAEGFDLAVEYRWLLESSPGRFKCSQAFVDRAFNAAARDRAEGITI